MTRHFAYATCLGCGKRGYYSKATAKKELRLRGLRGLSVYRCKASLTELWHWGHLPPNVKDGRFERGALGRAAPRVPRKGREFRGE